MQGFKKVLAGLLIIIMITGILPMGPGIFINRANAAGALGLRIADDGTGKLLTETSVTLQWNNVGANSYTVSYVDHTGHLIETPVGTAVRYKVDALQKDYIYQITVTAKFTSTPDVTDTKRVLTGTTFDVPKDIENGRPADTQKPLDGGGTEIGAKPGLLFKWKTPKMYNTLTGAWEFYTGPVDYNINIGTDIGANNMTQLKVRYSSAAGQYIATVARGGEVRTIAEKVYTNSVTGDIYFNCYGPDANNPSVLDTGMHNSAYPVNTDPGFNAKNTDNYNGNFPDLSKIYYNSDIKPGTVYRMKLEPVFNNDTSSDYTDILPANVKDGFTYTPIRFQISKDSANNLLMKIFKINQEGVPQSQRVSFTYQGMYSGNSNFSTYTLSAQQSDEFAPGEFLIIYIENMSYDNTNYYKVNASSPTSGQILYSDPISYAISQDISQAPLPENVQVSNISYREVQIDNTFYPDSGAPNPLTADVKTSNITLRWKKPFNFAELINGTDDVYFHVLLSNVQIPVTGGTERVDRIFGNDGYTKNYPYPATNGGYREVFKVNLKACTVTTDGYLEFTLDGAKLFSTVDGSGNYTQNLDNDNDYPTYLLPNKVYYLKMYSQKEKADGELIVPKSDTSIPVGLTTPAEPQSNLPSPLNFAVLKNGVSAPVEQLNHKPVVLKWEKIVLNGASNINYELFMSDGKSITHDPRDGDYYDMNIDSTSTTGTFIKIGSTQSLGADVVFGGFTDTASAIVEASISDFSTAWNSKARDAYGEGLRPNSTYYFIVRTTADVAGEPQVSNFSQILAVTTLKGVIVEPGEDTLKPRAPINFRVAADAAGNPMIDSSSVTLKWKEAEQNVKYTLIRTSQRIAADADLAVISANPENKYVEYLNFKDITVNNPDFTYNGETGEFTYKVRGLYPNMIYYFSLRAEKETSDPDSPVRLEPSQWNTVPVTTTLIEAPQLLEAISDHEVAVSFTASNIYTSDDMIVSVDGTRVPRGQVLISEQQVSGGNSIYYVRVMGLKPQTAYSINVKGSTVDGNGVPQSFNYDFPAHQVDPVLNTERTTTRDNMHEIDVKWKGKENNKYELAIKGETDADYTTLQEGNGFTYMSKEKPANMVTTDYSMFYARISGLKSNTRYYIKVRSLENNLITGENDYSVYIGPVTTRTEFSQQDYDNDEQDDREENSYWNQVNKLKENIYWVLEDSAGSYRIKLKGDKAANIINSSVSGNFTVSLAPTGSGTFSRGAVYIPLSTWELLLSKKESLTVETPAGRYVIRPEIINSQESPEIKQAKADSEIKEIYLYVEISRTDSRGYTLPAGSKPASDMFDFSVQVAGMRNNTDAATEKRIIEILDAYINTGLVRLQSIPEYQKSTSQGLYDVIDNIIDSLMSDFQKDIGNMMENQWYGIRKSTKLISAYNQPVAVSLPVNQGDRDLKSGYLYANSSWQQLPSTMGTGTINISLSKPGKIIALSTSAANLFSVPAGHWAERDISLFNSSFNIRDVLDLESGTQVDDSISVTKSVQLISKVLSSDNKYIPSGTTAEVAKAAGLDGTINFAGPQRSLTREEAASLIMKVYQLKTGADVGSMKPVRNTSIKDSAQIGSKLYKAVEMSVDMGFLTLDAGNSFKPKEECTWAQIISGLTRLLKKLGEI